MRLRLPSFPATLAPAQGFSMAEVLVATGIMGLLGAGGVAALGLRGCELSAAQAELRGSLDQAFAEARARGRNVHVSMSDAQGTDVLPVRLPRKVKFGKPAHIPLPPGVADPRRADETGEAHARITVTPRRTATAALWFLNDGEEALCMRLNGHGSVLMYRWRKPLQRWVRV